MSDWFLRSIAEWSSLVIFLAFRDIPTSKRLIVEKDCIKLDGRTYKLVAVEVKDESAVESLPCAHDDK
jgi:hypothetical protein